MNTILYITASVVENMMKKICIKNLFNVTVYQRRTICALIGLKEVKTINIWDILHVLTNHKGEKKRIVDKEICMNRLGLKSWRLLKSLLQMDRKNYVYGDYLLQMSSLSSGLLSTLSTTKLREFRMYSWKFLILIITMLISRINIHKNQECQLL